MTYILSSDVAKYVFIFTQHVFRSYELRWIQKCCCQNITAGLRKYINIKDVTVKQQNFIIIYLYSN